MGGMHHAFIGFDRSEGPEGGDGQGALLAGPAKRARREGGNRGPRHMGLSASRATALDVTRCAPGQVAATWGTDSGRPVWREA